MREPLRAALCGKLRKPHFRGYIYLNRHFIKRTFPRLLSAALVLCCLAEPASASYGAYTLRKESHEKYLDGTPAGAFQPSAVLTRAQAANLLYGLLEQPPAGDWQFTDIPAGAWYERAAKSLAWAGILPDDGSGRFRPDEPLTRKECAAMLAGFLEPATASYRFTDVPSESPEAGAIACAVAHGLFSADETGAFRPDFPMTRAETAVVFNHLLGRAPDAAELARTPEMRVFPDVNFDHWAYAAIMEATTTHTYTAVPGSPNERWTSFEREAARITDGFHSIDGWLYFARDGHFLTSQTVGSFTFGADGRYTTGNAALDQKLAEIIRTQTSGGMTRDETLRALYNYVRDNFTYIKRDLVSKGQTGWEPAYAERFFADGRGNCYGFAAAFQQLARAIGVEAVTVVGQLGKNRQPHGWVEISLDGVNAVYDPEIEMVYRGRGRAFDMFRFQYSAAPFDYWK